MLRAERSGVFHAPEVEGDEEATIELERHLGELLLRELIAGDRLAEHDPLLRVLERRLEAGAPRSHGAEHDSEPRLVQARERTAQRRHLG